MFKAEVEMYGIITRNTSRAIFSQLLVVTI